MVAARSSLCLSLALAGLYSFGVEPISAGPNTPNMPNISVPNIAPMRPDLNMRAPNALRHGDLASPRDPASTTIRRSTGAKGSGKAGTNANKNAKKKNKKNIFQAAPPASPLCDFQGGCSVPSAASAEPPAAPAVAEPPAAPIDQAGVQNPIPAAGGAGKEELSDARRDAPSSTSESAKPGGWGGFWAIDEVAVGEASALGGGNAAGGSGSGTGGSQTGAGGGNAGAGIGSSSAGLGGSANSGAGLGGRDSGDSLGGPSFALPRGLSALIEARNFRNIPDLKDGIGALPNPFGGGGPVAADPAGNLPFGNPSDQASREPGSNWDPLNAPAGSPMDPRYDRSGQVSEGGPSAGPTARETRDFPFDWQGKPKDEGTQATARAATSGVTNPPTWMPEKPKDEPTATQSRESPETVESAPKPEPTAFEKAFEPWKEEPGPKPEKEKDGMPNEGYGRYRGPIICPLGGCRDDGGGTGGPRTMPREETTSASTTHTQSPSWATDPNPDGSGGGRGGGGISSGSSGPGGGPGLTRVNPGGSDGPGGPPAPGGTGAAPLR